MPELEHKVPNRKEVNDMADENMNSQGSTGTGVVYGSFLERFIAVIIDGLILVVIGVVLNTVSVVAVNESGRSIIQLLSTVVGWAYYMYMDVSRGATLGKKAMGLRVQNVNTGENLTYMEAFLREVIGKILSSVVLLLGYFWMLWDDKKQTWHDKIGSSVVIKVK